MIKYTEEIKKYIIDNYKDLTNTELAKKCSEEFNLNFKEDSIANFKSKLLKNEGINLRNGLNGGCYKKGHIPINKGTKGMFNVGGNRTSFKKGNISPNNVPIETERNAKDGYIEIKVQDGCLNKNWQMKHRYIYEQHHGKIPASHKVIFADGNKYNFDLDNLVLVSNQEQFIMNQRKLIKKDKEITKAGVNIAKVINKTNKARKKLNEKK